MEIFLGIVRMLESTVGSGAVQQGADNINMPHKTYHHSCIAATGTSDHLLWASCYSWRFHVFFAFTCGSAESGTWLYLPWPASWWPLMRLRAIRTIMQRDVKLKRSNQKPALASIFGFLSFSAEENRGFNLFCMCPSFWFFSTEAVLGLCE